MILESLGTAGHSMASLFERKNSAFWWVKFRDPATGKIERESTKCRIGNGAHLRRAREIKAEKTRAENQTPVVKDRAAWDGWVEEFLRRHYVTSPKTLNRFLVCWKTLRHYLALREVRYPSQLTYKHAVDYVEWRQNPRCPGIHKASRITALLEIKLLRILMNEAIRQGMASANPCARLGLKRGPIKEKPEITDDEIATIRQALKTRPEWMEISFEIAIHQGCRFAETCLPMTDVDVAGRHITFHAKGGKVFTTRLHDSLVPMFARFEAEGRERTFEMPVQTGREWTRFFRKIGLPHLCFHCTRVSVVTRLCRAGVTESQAMRFVGHASETIHRIYQRLRAEDVSACVSALRIPSNENQDLPPANPGRAAESSSSHTQTDTRRPASPTHTKATSSKR